MNRNALVVSLHDVSPHTLEPSRLIMNALEALGVSRCSLLVIPDHHRRGHFLSDRIFCEWLNEMSRKGHEIVIHGYFHSRLRRDNERFLDRLTTRVYTADEGEFFDLDKAQATELVKKARNEFNELGVDPAGFIAPAWLLSSAAKDALKELGILYTTRLGSVVDLQNHSIYHSQSLVWSVRSQWRRWVSLAWNAFLFKRLASNPLMRISIHPVDHAHPRIWKQIRELVSLALALRKPLTYETWVRQSASTADY